MSTYIINTEPEMTSAADADEMVIYDSSASATKKVGVDTLRAYMNSGVTNITTDATLSATQLAHGGKTVTINKADGCVVTLPAASGTGARFHFIVGTTITSNSFTVQVDSASATMTGVAIVLQDGGNTMVGFETAADTDTVAMNGTTTGGIKGDSVECIDIGSNLWYVRVNSSATGTEATPFSAAVA